MEELVAALERHGDDWAAGMNDLRDVSRDCPACILAAIRQSKRLQAVIAVGPDPPLLNFDFRAEVTAFWNHMNAAANERDRANEAAASYSL